MFGWFTKKDTQLEIAKKALLGLVYKESKGGGDREVFWVGRSEHDEKRIRVGIKFYGRTYFLDAVGFAEDLNGGREGWEIVRKG